MIALFLYGESLFTTFRCYEGTPFSLGAHVDRLNHSIETLWQIEDRFDADQIAEQIKVLVLENQCPDGMGRLMISRGTGGGPVVPKGCKTRALLTLSPLTYIPSQMALMWSDVRRDPEGFLCKHKRGSFADNLFAREQAIRQGYGEALMLDTTGFVMECSCANIFVVRNRVLHTPPAAQANVLPGITRQVVIDCANDCGVTVVEAPLTRAACEDADEMFLTNSRVEVMPVSRLAAGTFDPVPGQITSRLAEAYRSVVTQKTMPELYREQKH